MKKLIADYLGIPEGSVDYYNLRCEYCLYEVRYNSELNKEEEPFWNIIEIQLSDLLGFIYGKIGI